MDDAAFSGNTVELPVCLAPDTISALLLSAGDLGQNRYAYSWEPSASEFISVDGTDINELADAVQLPLLRIKLLRTSALWYWQRNS